MSPMIGRLWTGRCTPENAEAYETLLITKIIPELDRAEGCLGACVLRRQDGKDIARDPVAEPGIWCDRA